MRRLTQSATVMVLLVACPACGDDRKRTKEMPAPRSTEVRLPVRQTASAVVEEVPLSDADRHQAERNAEERGWGFRVEYLDEQERWNWYVSTGHSLHCESKGSSSGEPAATAPKWRTAGLAKYRRRAGVGPAGEYELVQRRSSGQHGGLRPEPCGELPASIRLVCEEIRVPVRPAEAKWFPPQKGITPGFSKTGHDLHVVPEVVVVGRADHLPGKSFDVGGKLVPRGTGR